MSIPLSRFPGAENIFNILSQNAQVGLIALGMTFVMIAGGFDLSVGAIYAAGATVYAMEAKAWPLPSPPCSRWQSALSLAP